MAELIPNGIAAAPSVEFTLAAGDQATIFLKDGGDSSGQRRAQVQIKSAGGTWTTVATLSGAGASGVLQAAGTFRVIKGASDIPFGVDKV